MSSVNQYICITFVYYHVMNIWTDRQKYRQTDRQMEFIDIT